MDLVLDAVSVKLGGETVVRDVNATLTLGKLHVMVGPNGAGKTTLLKAMASLLPLSDGSVRLGDDSLAAMTPQRRAEQVAYLPQDRTIAWDLPCVDVAALGAQHLPADLARQKAFGELQALGLQEVSDKGVFGLSGGQRARVLLARVLISPAHVFLLDEPLIALDPAWQRHVLTRLKQRCESGQTIVLSLHDLHLAAQFADEVMLMHHGRLIALDKAENVFSAKLLADVFNLSGKMSHAGGKPSLRLDSQPLLQGADQDA